MVEKPEEEIQRLEGYLGKEFEEKVYKTMKIPSPEVRKESAILTGESLIDKWKKKITAEEKRKMLDILSLFGLDSIYAEDSLPYTTGLKKI